MFVPPTLDCHVVSKQEIAEVRIMNKNTKQTERDRRLTAFAESIGLTQDVVEAMWKEGLPVEKWKDDEYVTK